MNEKPDDTIEKRFNTVLEKRFANIEKRASQFQERIESKLDRKTEFSEIKPRPPILPRVDPLNLPYRPKLIIPKEKIEELFNIINQMDTQQLKQYSLVNSINLNVDDADSGDTLIHKVITSSNLLKKEFHRLNTIKFLVQNNVNPDKPNRENQTPLHLACRTQMSTVVEYLISLKVDLNYIDNYGYTPLHYALQGKIELFEENKEVKEFISKPKKIDFGKKEDLLEIKKDLWELVKKDPFLGLLKNTLESSIFSDPTIEKLLLNLNKKIVDKSLDDKVVNKLKFYKEELEIIRSSINSIVKKNWNGFPNLTELEIHEKDDKSWVHTPDSKLSPLKINDVKKELRKIVKDGKEEIKNLCESVKKINYEVDQDYQYRLTEFYIDFIKENEDHFDASRVVADGGTPNQRTTKYYLNGNIDETSWNNYNEEKLDSKAIDFADNIIDWEDLSFIGGSRQILIRYIDEPELQQLINYTEIEKKVFHILLGDLIYNGVNIKDLVVPGGTNFTPVTVTDGLGGNLIIDYTIVGEDENDWIQYDKIILAWNNIFKDKAINFPDSPAPGGGFETWDSNPTRKSFIDKWSKLFYTKNKASVLYTMYSAYACLDSDTNLEGELNSTLSGLCSALYLCKDKIITNEILGNGLKRFIISWLFNQIVSPLPAPAALAGPGLNINKEIVIGAAFQVLLSANLIGTNFADYANTILDPSNNELLSKITNLLTLTDNIEIQNKTNEIIKDLIKKINEMVDKPMDTDILGIITFLNNGFKDADLEHLRIDRIYLQQPPLPPLGAQPNINVPNFNPPPDIYNSDNNINKIIHIIKKREVSSLVPYINHIFETIKEEFRPPLINAMSNNDFSHLKLQEARCLGLYYLGLIPNFNNFKNRHNDKNYLVKSLHNGDINKEIIILANNAPPPPPGQTIPPLPTGLPYEFNIVGGASDGTLRPGIIPLPGNFIDVITDPNALGVLNLELIEKLNYFSDEFVHMRRPPFKYAVDILRERNKNYLINILHHVLFGSPNSLYSLIDDNRNLSKSFTEIYPIITILIDLLKYYGYDNENVIEKIILQLNKYNGYIFLYYYVFNQNKLMKIPKFNYYEIPSINKKGKFLYFNSSLNNLYDNSTNELIDPSNIADGTQLTNIPNNIESSTIYNQGLFSFKKLMDNISNNSMKGNYIIKQNELILSKESKLPPALSSMLGDLYKYNLMKIIIEVLNTVDIGLISKIKTLLSKYNILDNDVQIYFIIGKLTQEIVNEQSKLYIQSQTALIINEIINSSQLQDFQSDLLVNPGEYEIKLNNANLDNLFIYRKDRPINYFQFSGLDLLEKNKRCNGKDDIYEFIIYPEEYANSELLKSKYILKTHNKLYLNLLNSDINPYILDLNNQSAIFPVLKFHEDEIIKKLKERIDYREFSDINVFDFLKDEFNRHLFKLTNDKKNMKEWLCNFVLYQKEEVLNLILSNDKFGNNVPNHLDESFMIICYIMNQYLSESIYKIENSDILNNIISNLHISKSHKNYNTYLFINEIANRLNIYNNDEDNFISDLVHNKIKEKRILEKNNEKLVKGATKLEIEREIINKENEIIGLKAILVGNLIDKKNSLNNFPILERYSSLVNNDNIGTLSKLLSILVNSNQLHNSLDLITFKLHQIENIVLNENNKDNLFNLLKTATDFYNHTNNIGEIYFGFGKYTDKNNVLKFVKDLLIFMCKIFIIHPYIMTIKKILYEYFKNKSPDMDPTDINRRIEFCFTYDILLNDKLVNLKNVLLEEIPTKIVENSTIIFENSNKENEINFESTKEILDSVTTLLTLNPIKPIDENDIVFKNIKEVNVYFDTFVNRTILNWNVVVENVLKFNINQGRIIRSIKNLITNSE